MNEMVERVARELEPLAWRALGLCDTLAYASRRTSSLRKARRALKALREPTQAMIELGSCQTHAPGVNPRAARPLAHIMARDCWRAMIDAALAEENARA